MANTSPLTGRSTAIEALNGEDLTGKHAIITGGNSGIGVETARALASAGAHVVLCSRSLDAGKNVAQELRNFGVKGKITVRQLDLADLRSVENFAKQASAELEHVDILLLNAGVMALPKRVLTANGFEMQIGTNHIGHQYLTELLLPKLKQAPSSRVVSVSSEGHRIGGLDIDDLNWKTRKYSSWSAYGQSKLANILFAKELAKRMEREGTDVKAYSLHPGVINTNLSRHMWGGSMFRFAARFLIWLPGVKTVEQGAATSVYAAVSPELKAHSGAYLSDCKVASPSKQAQDATLASSLWAKTEELIKAALEQNRQRIMEY